MKNLEEGITLIALVITIIVLLILTGISIGMLAGEGGILSRANKSKEKADEASVIEKINMAILSAKIEKKGEKLVENDLQQELNKEFDNGILKPYNNDDEFIYYVNNSVYKISKDGAMEFKFSSAIDKKEENRNINGEYKYAYNNPVIPKGFIPLETKDASWVTNEEGIPIGWNKGLVIIDELGNEFVWIPCTNKELEVNEKVVKYGSYVKDNRFTNYQVDINSLYDIKEYIPVEEEVSQIDKYQGFYVGRYETGMSENIPKVSDVDTEGDVININNSELKYNNRTVMPVIMQGKEVWNFICRDTADKISRKIANNESVKSGLITGKQWDTMLAWIIESGIYNNSSEADKYYAEIGNFYNSEYTINGLHGIEKDNIVSWNNGEYHKDTKEKAYLGSGVHNNSKVNNIYDVYGNLWEKTTETDKDGKMVQRGIGANAGSNKAAGVHRHGDKDAVGSVGGFRIVLYVL